MPASEGDAKLTTSAVPPSFVVALGTSGIKRARAYDGATGKPIAAPSGARIKFLLAVEAARLEVRRRKKEEEGERRRRGERLRSESTIDLDSLNLKFFPHPPQKKRKQQHQQDEAAGAPPDPFLGIDDDEDVDGIDIGVEGDGSEEKEKGKHGGKLDGNEGAADASGAPWAALELVTAARGEVDVFVDAIDEAETAQHVSLAPIRSSSGGGKGGAGAGAGEEGTETFLLAAALGASAADMSDAARRLRRASRLMRARARAAAAATRDAGLLAEGGGWPVDAAPTSSLWASAMAAAAASSAPTAGAPPAFAARVGLPGGPFEPPVVSYFRVFF